MKYLKHLENILDFFTYIVGVLFITLSFAVAQGIVNIDGIPPLVIFIFSIIVVGAVSITAIERGLRKINIAVKNTYIH